MKAKLRQKKENLATKKHKVHIFKETKMLHADYWPGRIAPGAATNVVVIR